MITLVCYGCEAVERDCCGGDVMNECFSGLYIDNDGEISLIHSPFVLYPDVSGAASGVVVSDYQGNYYQIPVSGTSYSDLDELQSYVENCRCGGIYREEITGIVGTSFDISINNGFIPSSQDKCHLIVDGREKRHDEWSVSGNTITTTFNIFYDNRLVFWYQSF